MAIFPLAVWSFTCLRLRKVNQQANSALWDSTRGFRTLTASTLTAVLHQGARVLALAVGFGMTLVHCPAAAAAAQPPATVQTDGRPGAPAVGAVAANDFLDSLTAAERVWLRDHPVISVAQDPNWPPIEFTDERGTPSGMTADYVSLVEQRLGVKFQQVNNLSWQEAYARMKRGEIDMTTSVAVTQEREMFWAFTKPYMTIPLVIVTRSDVTYIADLRELEGKTVVVVAGYVAETWIARDFPKIQLVRVQTTQEALARLQRGEVFACVENMLVVDRAITTLKMSGLKITGSTPYNNAQCMAVRKDWAILAGILDQALDSVSATERNTIFRKWLPLQSQPAFDYTRLWPVAAILAAVLMGLSAWIVTLTMEIRQRKRAEEALREREIMLSGSQRAAHIGSWSMKMGDARPYFSDENYRIYGLNPADGAPAPESFFQLVHPEDRDRMREWHQAILAEWHPPALEFRALRPDGSIRVIRTEGDVIETVDGVPSRIAGTSYDVTERKQAEEALRQKAEALRASHDELEQFNRAIRASERDLRNSQQIAHLGSWRLDVATGQVTWTEELYRMYGADPVLPPPPYTEHGKLFTPASWERLTSALGHTKETGMPYELELETVRTDGSHGWMWVRGEVVKDVAGNTTALWGAAQDITGRKQMEEALRQRAEALRASNVELEQFNRAMVGRELRMIELKREVNELCRRLGEPPRHPDQLPAERVPGVGQTPAGPGGGGV